jgi:hypothetical protein
MLRTCSRPGCAVLTLGALCAGHDDVVTRMLTRGRPFREPEAGSDPAAVAVDEERLRGRDSNPNFLIQSQASYR